MTEIVNLSFSHKLLPMSMKTNFNLKKNKQKTVSAHAFIS